MADEADPLRGNPGLQTSESATDYELQRQEFQFCHDVNKLKRNNQCTGKYSVAEPESRSRNYELRAPTPDSYYFIKDWKKFFKKKSWFHQAT